MRRKRGWSLSVSVEGRSSRAFGRRSPLPLAGDDGRRSERFMDTGCVSGCVASREGRNANYGTDHRYENIIAVPFAAFAARPAGAEAEDHRSRRDDGGSAVPRFIAETIWKAIGV